MCLLFNYLLFNYYHIYYLLFIIYYLLLYHLLFNYSIVYYLLFINKYSLLLFYKLLVIFSLIYEKTEKTYIKCLNM